MLFLRQEGLIVPDDLDDKEERLDIDFTSASNRAIGAIHSRFANRHAYALFVSAKNSTRLIAKRRKLRLLQAKYRVRHQPEYKTAKELEAAMSLTPKIKTLEDEIMELEIRQDLLKAVEESYLDVVRAASREITSRGQEQGARD